MYVTYINVASVVDRAQYLDNLDNRPPSTTQYSTFIHQKTSLGWCKQTIMTIRWQYITYQGDTINIYMVI